MVIKEIPLPSTNDLRDLVSEGSTATDCANSRLNEENRNNKNINSFLNKIYQSAHKPELRSLPHTRRQQDKADSEKVSGVKNIFSEIKPFQYFGNGIVVKFYLVHQVSIMLLS